MKRNHVQLKEVKEIRDISFGHVLMAETIGKVIANFGKPTTFSPIIKAKYNKNGDLVITRGSI